MHNTLKSKGIAPSGIIDGYLMIAEAGAATVKESLTVQNDGSRRIQRIARERFDAFDENRRIAEARQADAEEIAELARIEKQLEQKKETR
jgi:hypothetical protein